MQKIILTTPVIMATSEKTSSCIHKVLCKLKKKVLQSVSMKFHCDFRNLILNYTKSHSLALQFVCNFKHSLDISVHDISNTKKNPQLLIEEKQESELYSLYDAYINNLY